MTTNHGLTNKTLAQITGVLAAFSQVEKALLFGSRAKGTHKPGSDIDLALVGGDLDWQTLGRISGALDDLPIPYRFSLIMFSKKTDSEVAAHIRRVGIPLFERNAMVAANR
jgi:predicted nucleotidyltransferase